MSIKTKLQTTISKFCVTTIFYVSRTNIKLFFSNQFSYSIGLLFVLTRILVFIEIPVKLPKVINNLLEEINPQWDCIVAKKHIQGAIT